MANEAHLAILKQGVEAWNRWRKDNPNVEPDIRGAYLCKAKLKEADLRQANLCKADLKEANLCHADLREGTSAMPSSVLLTSKKPI